MSDPPDRGFAEDAPAAGLAQPSNAAVPAGNLFATPKLTALDPADKGERRSVERLLETLDDHN